VQNLQNSENIRQLLTRSASTSHYHMRLFAGLGASYMRETKPPRLRKNTHSEVVPAAGVYGGEAAGAAMARDTRPLPFPQPPQTASAYAFQAPIYHAAQWLSMPEAAAYTGLPQSALRRLMADGKLRGLDTGPRLGGRWRIKRSDLDAISA